MTDVTPEAARKLEKAREPDRPDPTANGQPPTNPNVGVGAPDAPPDARPQLSKQPQGFSDTEGGTSDFQSHADGEDY
jgi:hypothetical protein